MNSEAAVSAAIVTAISRITHIALTASHIRPPSRAKLLKYIIT